MSLLLLATSWFALRPAPARAQELLSWWNRGLLPVELTAGSWAVFASEELAEGQVYVDTLSVHVYEADSDSLAWVEVADAGTAERDLLLIDVRELGADGPLLDALIRHLRWLPGGEVIEEDVEEHRRSRLVQRHFQDPFESPQITRQALPDTLVGARSIARERVVLEELREESTPVDGLTQITRLVSVAELSPDLPIFGVLRAQSVTEVATRSESRRDRRMPPLRSEFRWQCLEWGRDGAKVLPVGIPAP